MKHSYSSFPFLFFSQSTKHQNINISITNFYRSLKIKFKNSYGISIVTPIIKKHIIIKTVKLVPTYNFQTYNFYYNYNFDLA